MHRDGFAYLANIFFIVQMQVIDLQALLCATMQSVLRKMRPEDAHKIGGHIFTGLLQVCPFLYLFLILNFEISNLTYSVFSVLMSLSIET